MGIVKTIPKFLKIQVLSKIAGYMTSGTEINGRPLAHGD
jgi:hypothetical protein